MKKGTIIILIVVAVIAIIGMSLVGSYNNMVNLKENVETKKADVSVALERRADLIPNLVNTVKGYAAHEEKVINDVTEARKALLNAESITELSEANENLSKAINNLLVIVENYPDLKANTNFINLQDELAGTENRIAVARKDYNEAVKSYNTSIKKFPNNMIASMFNFNECSYFEASSDKTEVPNVEF